MSKALIEVSVVMCSDQLFILFTLFSLACAISYWAKPDLLSLIFFSVSVMLACLTRYNGMGLILMGCILFLIMAVPNKSLGSAITHLFLFVLITVVPLSILFLRNYALTGTLSGPRPPALITPLGNIFDTVKVIFSWYIPRAYFRNWQAAVGCFGVLLIIGYSIRDAVFRKRLFDLIPVFLIVLSYLLFLIVSASSTNLQRIDNRYLAPIYIPINILFLVFAKQIMHQTKKYWGGISRILLIFVVSIWLLFLTSTFLPDIRTRMTQGVEGINISQWKNSATIQSLDSKKYDDKTIYSNAPEILYLVNIQAKLTPECFEDNSPLETNNLYDLLDTWPKTNSYLIWFKNYPRPYLFTLEQLSSVVNVELIEEFSDGGIYAISQKPH
jgi:hypothetical protein